MALKARRKKTAPLSLDEFDLSGLIKKPVTKKQKQEAAEGFDLKDVSDIFSHILKEGKNAKPTPTLDTLLPFETNPKPEDTPQGYYVKAEELAPGMLHGLDYSPNYPPAEILSVSENLGGRVKVRYNSPNRGDGREGIAEAIIRADKWCFILRGKTHTSAMPVSGKRPVGRPRKNPTEAEAPDLFSFLSL